MRIILSPAKKMNVDTDSLPWQDMPAFLPKTEELFKALQGMSADELKKLWKCNDAIAQQNIERLRYMDLHTNLTPAILSYEGIQYQYMAPSVFTERELSYVQEHVRILSGFYGILRPFDGVTPYRLEMQAKLRAGGAKDLYAFWGDSLAKTLLGETDCILNLASKEYSQCISRFLPDSVPFITCVFGEEKDGRILEKGTLCKMARGEMVRYMAENDIRQPQQLVSFDRLQYRYSPLYSDADTYVFLKSKSKTEVF